MPQLDEDLVAMRVGGIVMDPRAEVPVIVLRGLKEPRLYLPIFIGSLEATAIATVLAEVSLPRPMTHDLLANVLAELRCRVERVTVTRLVEGTFYAELTLVDEAGAERVVDARPSDGIALALRVDAPIFVAKGVVVEAGALSPPEDARKAAAEAASRGDDALAAEDEGLAGADDEGEDEPEATPAPLLDPSDVDLEDLDPEDFGKYKM